MPLQVKQVAAGQRNVTYQIRGFLPDGSLPPTPVEIQSKVKLASLVWVVQEKLAVDLWWATDDLILTMESRNSVRFDTSLVPPEGWDGNVYLSSIPDKPEVRRSFLIVLDFDI